MAKRRKTESVPELELEFHPLTPQRWEDFAALFGERGACGGCWCMFWRLPRKTFDAQKGDGNRDAMKAIVEAGEVPGILAYHDGSAVGWCSVSPRDSYPALDRSRVMKRVDDAPVWSVSCLFVARDYRNRGVSVRLLRAAADHVSSHGGTLLEGYPVAPKADKMSPAFAWTGLESAFLKAGFSEVARRSETRPIMRLTLRED